VHDLLALPVARLVNTFWITVIDLRGPYVRSSTG
jgi:hypothetical protein